MTRPARANEILSHRNEERKRSLCEEPLGGSVVKMLNRISQHSYLIDTHHA